MSYTVRLTAARVAIDLAPLLTVVIDVHFPTSLTSDGSDPMYVLGSSIFVGFAVGTESGHRNTECDYSGAYVSIYTENDLDGHSVCSYCCPGEFYTHAPIHQMTFTISR